MAINKPTYLLVCLIEECAEIIQRACKAIRFGFDEIQPGQTRNNIERISEEINDLRGVLMMLDNEDIDLYKADMAAVQRKIDKVRSFMPLSRERGMLEPEA